ncbi:MAG: hypothetical protein Ta2G_09080 [Termitinemataceae bacterium]|nr:MAG: hypothetical protein Ta2G_09080 [Termitinemataceae bacterium]
MTKFDKICTENVPLYALGISILLAALVFISRPPAILLTDEMFTTIYGQQREHYRHIEMTARIFRRIKILRMAVDASAESVAIAIAETSKKPAFVVFPSHYTNVLPRYLQDFPYIKCYIVADFGNSRIRSDGAQLINTGIAVDYYRAGLAAGILSNVKIKDEEGNLVDDQNSSVLFFPSTADQVLNESFSSGVQTNSAAKIVSYLNDSTDISGDFKTAVILTGAQEFLKINATKFNTKLIIKSWIDPEYTPPNTIAVFDDSPIMLLPQISKISKKRISEEPIFVSSKINFLFSRIDDFRLIPSLAAVIKKNL